MYYNFVFLLIVICAGNLVGAVKFAKKLWNKILMLMCFKMFFTYFILFTEINIECLQMNR